jgi:hypothetical protein
MRGSLLVRLGSCSTLRYERVYCFFTHSSCAVPRVSTHVPSTLLTSSLPTCSHFSALLFPSYFPYAFIHLYTLLNGSIATNATTSSTSTSDNDQGPPAPSAVSVSDIAGCPESNGNDNGVDTSGSTTVDETSMALQPTPSNPQQGTTKAVGTPAGGTSEKKLGRRESNGEWYFSCRYVASHTRYFPRCLSLRPGEALSWQSVPLHSTETANQRYLEWA